MNVKLMSSNLAQPNVPVIVTQNTIETIVAESQLTIGNAVAVVIGAPPVTYSYILVNRSTGGQNIRVGFAPSFAGGAVKGDMLAPGDSIVISSLGTTLSGIADGAGALLDRLVLSP